MIMRSEWIAKHNTSHWNAVLGKPPIAWENFKRYVLEHCSTARVEKRNDDEAIIIG